MNFEELRRAYEESLAELEELGEVWLEFRAAKLDTRQIELAIGQVIRESRRYEKKLRNVDRNQSNGQ